MDIVIIGSGKIGGTLAGLFARAGHRVALSNSRGPESLADAVAAIDGDARAATVADAAEFGEVVIVAVPFVAFRDLPAGPLAGRVVVDAMNHYAARDGEMAELERMTSSEMVAARLPGARLVKALNTIYFVRLRDEGRPAGDPARLAIPIAGDDGDAKATVAALISQIGFDAVDAGTLAASGRQQPGSAIYNAPLTAAELTARLTAAPG